MSVPARITQITTLTLLTLAGRVWGQPCAPQWSARFANNGPDAIVQSLASITDSAGPALYVGGRFEHVAGTAMPRIARWGGGGWSGLGAGIPGQFNSHGYFGCCATVFTVTGAVSPGAVFIGGDFIQADGVLLESAAQWQGGTWNPMAGGVEVENCVDCGFRVYASLVHDDGHGRALFAAGTFDRAGGNAASRIARWDGSAWSGLGAGLGTLPSDPNPCWVQALAVYDDGTGPKLYVAGAFSKAGETETVGIARWDGQAWTDVGGGLVQSPGGHVPTAGAMAVFDDGHGPALYLAGYFEQVGTTVARNIARWNGTSWSALGAGVGSGVNDQVRALAVFDDGNGPALYVGGDFDDAGGSLIYGLARWRGSTWSEVGFGVTGGGVYALTTHEDSQGRALVVGGAFQAAGGMPVAYLAEWVACFPCYANCDASTALPLLNVLDFGCFLNQFASGNPAANCDASTTPPTLNVQDFVCFLNRFAAGCS